MGNMIKFTREIQPVIDEWLATAFLPYEEQEEGTLPLTWAPLKPKPQSKSRSIKSTVARQLFTKCDQEIYIGRRCDNYTTQNTSCHRCSLK